MPNFQAGNLCPDANSLAALVDGELAGEAFDTLHRHLETCEPCRLLFAEIGRSLAAEDSGGPDESRVDQYRIEERLGRGGMGVVHRARDLTTGATVAIKLLDARLCDDHRAIARFAREAAATSALDHPNIGKIFHVGEHRGAPYIAMALHEGGTLADRLRRGRVSIAEAIALAHQIASGLGAAHAAGVIHRDVKPRNILLSATGEAILVDFGLAKIRAAGTFDSLTGSGELLGTLHYMAPEQLKRKAIDPRTDLWALGAVLYELLTGAPPFHSSSSLLVSSRIRSEDPRAPSILRPDLPPALDQLVLRLLAKPPDLRPTEAAEVIAALERIQPA